MKRPNIEAAVREFGVAVTRKLSGHGARGEPEEQLRAPFEVLLTALAREAGIQSEDLAIVGETKIGDLKTRPDYAVSVGKALVGFVELKAPGKGADPRRFKDAHDKGQWEKLRSLPNVIYSDGNAFSLWQDGELACDIVELDGDVGSSGADLRAPPGLPVLIAKFLLWKPIPPTTARELAHTTARLCRLLRDEVAEQLGRGSEALTALATDWRQLLFPEANDETFADGYAQAVTFGLLLARAKRVRLAGGLQAASAELSKSHSLIGTALRLLTDNAENQVKLKTSIGTLVRVLDEVSWANVSKDEPDAWLYFYEEFLDVYDKDLRKQTGSYYTPPQVVNEMVRLVDDVLRSPRFNQSAGLASPAVTICDPAMGTGTFLLGILRHVADTVETDEGKGAVYSAIDAALRRLVAFEIQLGPFAVAQLRVFGEVVELTEAAPASSVRMYVTDTLGDPADDQGWFPEMLAPLAKSRREANKIKRDEPITVVIGNPPYKEKAKGRGGWIEGVGSEHPTLAPLATWMPPAEWGVGAHAKHLRNLYVYFWRWATWKVFDHHPANRSGIVCFITVAGFLNGPGFQRMRDYLRRSCDDIWVIDCSPEGHQPEVPTRIFQGVQQPVCIVLASRSRVCRDEVPARVRFRALCSGRREEKFKDLAAINLGSPDWHECSTEWRASFMPDIKGAWATYPSLEDFFVWNGSGVMPGRTWVIAPDADSLLQRWNALITAPHNKKAGLFHPHIRKGEPGDKHVDKRSEKTLCGQPARPIAVAADQGPCLTPVPYGYRTLDRQYVIPDNRLINQPNPDLWEMYSDAQVFATALTRVSPTSGPALTVTALIPDLHHYKGSFGGRAFPLMDPRRKNGSNIQPGVLAAIGGVLHRDVLPEELFCYVVALLSHPAYIVRFKADLATPGLRVPVTADAALFFEAVEIGRQVVWAQTFGARFVDAAKGRPAGPPRMPKESQPRIPAGGAIPSTAEGMPDEMRHDQSTRRLYVGSGYVEHVLEDIWNYEVSGKQVLTQWFSYRRRDRSRPVIGDRREPSPLGKIQPDHWIPEYTTELLNLLNVLGILVGLEPVQAKLLERVCAGPNCSLEELRKLGAFERAERAANPGDGGPGLFSGDE